MHNTIHTAEPLNITHHAMEIGASTTQDGLSGRRHAHVVTTTALAAGGLLVTATAPAVATPSSGVEARELYRSSADGRDFILRDITIAPGGSTGWHWHDGTVIGAEPVVLEVLYANPVGRPLAEDVGEPPCQLP